MKNQLKDARRNALKAAADQRAKDVKADWGDQSYWDKDWCARSIKLNCGEMDLILNSIRDSSHRNTPQAAALHAKVWKSFQAILISRGESV